MVFFPQIHNPSLITRKHQKTQIDGSSTKYLTSISQNCHGHEKQGKTEKLLKIGRNEGDMTTKGNWD